MPELPEVETIARRLKQEYSLPGKTIHSATVLWDKTVAIPDASTFCTTLPGLRIDSIGRRGKYLLIELPPYSLLIHLRMSGDIRVEHRADPIEKHDRLVIEFTDQKRLVFNDTRKFGRVWLTTEPQEVLQGLGLEPFDPELTNEVFFKMLQASKRAIKPLLHDQAFLAGLGNIYINEALFLSRIHPLKPANQINANQAGSLLAAIQTVLEKGIEQNGASIDWVYRGGGFQNLFNVYGKKGQPCQVCGTPLEAVQIGQRGSFYCPKCQVLED